MKPIIIGVNKDGKVEMTLDEFRKHMDDAYWQGHRDGSLTGSTNGNGRWWETQPYFAGTDITDKAADTACSNANTAVYTKVEG